LPAQDDRDARYAEILKRIEQRKKEQVNTPIQSLLSGALDALNAAGLLSAIKRRPPKNMSAYGPKTFNGSLVGAASPELWVGTIMWHKPKGYQYYQTLRLLGIWAIGHGSSTRIVIGEKRLGFSAPIFNPESYYYHIKRKFDLYYAGNASPPLDEPDNPLLYDAVYDEAQRLEMRAAMESALRNWVVVYKPDSDERE
jgi:hypothetical protein